MASAPQQAQLPLFYNDLMPLNTRDHAGFKRRMLDRAEWLATQHAIPLTVEEFVPAQRSYPIIFTQGENPLPLALMGLNEGVNTFVDADGKVTEPVYLPAYIRRYPFLLARLNQDSEELSLCFDPSSGSVDAFDDGEPLFDEKGETTQVTKDILEFCQNFEEAGMRTKALVDELTKHKLLMDGEVAIEDGSQPGKPFVYRGFQMIDQEKLRALPNETVIEWNANGILPLIHAHLFSLDNMRVIFGRQVQQGKMPQPNANAPTNAETSAVN